jgi:glycosyltransferase involved in cell wall biosynthesis
MTKMGANTKKADRIRVLVFGRKQLDLQPMINALSPFADIREVEWPSKPLSDSSKNVFLKAFYSLIEAYFYRVLTLFKEIHVFKANVVLVQYAFHTGLVAGIAARLARRPCVIQAIGSDLKVEPLNRTHRAIVCLALKIVSGVICVSRDMESIAKALGAQKTVAIPYPLDLTDFSERKSSKKMNQVVTVTRLIPIKGISYLIKAMAYVEEGTLLIIGDGPERKKTQSLLHSLGLQDRVTLLGWVDRRSMWRYLQQSTVFVLPSLSEGSPRVIPEAMMCGLPIVATRVGGIPEMMTDGLNGILVPPRNEKVLAEAIRRVLQDPIFQRNASMENKTIARKYEISSIGPRVYSHLTSFVED